MTCPSSLLCRRPAVGDALSSLAARVRGDDVLGQFTRFVLVGGTSTLVYAVLFVTLQGLGYLPAHLVATAASTVLANEMHRRLTFRADGRVHWFTAQWEASSVTLLGMAATSAALGVLDSTVGSTSVALQVSLVMAVTGLIGLMRFVVLRWLFRSPAADPA